LDRRHASRTVGKSKIAPAAKAMSIMAVQSSLPRYARRPVLFDLFAITVKWCLEQAEPSYSNPPRRA
jgi:hypothetical protein